MTDAPMEAWHDLHGFARDCLVAAAHVESTDRPSYGLAIKRDLEAKYGTEINHGRLYPNLDSLVDAGLMAKSPLDDRTNEYLVTEDGFRLLDAATKELEIVTKGAPQTALADGGDGDA